MARSKIEWLARPGTVPESWNPVTGCTKISEGCRNCYAERMARRLASRCGYPPAPNHFDVTLRPERLEQPLKWRKPRTVFVCSMGDLFHEDVPWDFIDRVFHTIEIARRHTFIALTKRPDKMLAYMEARSADFPLSNLIGMVTVEDQDQIWRIDELVKCPFAVRGVSVEPMLGAVDLADYMIYRQPSISEPRFYFDERDTTLLTLLDWVIAGGESGPGARPAHPDRFRSLRDQCQAAGVAYFFKQHGAWLHGSQVEPVAMQLADKYPLHRFPDGSIAWRVGKKAAGRLLDGREWNEWPEVNNV